MEKNNRKLLPLAYLVMVCYPLYVSGDVWFNGIQNYCTRKNGRSNGAFCQWGPDLGNFLFGTEHAYRGFALLMLGVGMSLALFLYWLQKPAHQ
jgi:hypothetical protein